MRFPEPSWSLALPTQKPPKRFISPRLTKHWNLIRLIGASSRCVTRHYSVDGSFVRVEERRYKDRVIMLTTMLQYMQEKSAPPGLVPIDSTAVIIRRGDIIFSPSGATGVLASLGGPGGTGRIGSGRTRGWRGKEGSGDCNDVGGGGSINLGRVGRGVGIGVSGGDHAGGGDLDRGCPAAFIGRSAGAGGCGSGRDLPARRSDCCDRKREEVITYGSGGGGDGGSEEGGLDEDVGDVFGKEDDVEEVEDESLDASEIIEGLTRSVFGRCEVSKIGIGDEEDMM
ncbi:hypothetical protein BC827DRAFT_1154960 [Russula dissimulans]|nr:hypothetical protein BC827DRAFT_1154960 [Russula dissimulans]